MKEKIMKKKDFITTKWGGGETTQLMIYPENAVFADRDFSFRVSSAIFTSTSSDFSDFTGYQRYILPLKGNLKLYHKALYNRTIDEYEVEYFDGSWSTFSENTIDCRDYNFIVKNGSIAKMQILKEKDKYVLKDSQIVTIFSTEDYEIQIEEGLKRLEGFSLLFLETDREYNMEIMKASVSVVLTEFLKE